MLIIAHRGGPKYAPENTLAAFRNVIAVGVDGWECDVQMTRDGELVVIHDETVDRTTNGTGAVRDMTLADIRALDAGQGEKVPTLHEVLELAKSAGVKLLAEIKSPHLYPGIEARLLAALEAANYFQQTVIMSFDGVALNTVWQLNPSAQLGALYDVWQFDVSAPPGRAENLCPMAEMVLIYPWMMRQARRDRRRVIVWFGRFENRFMFSALQALGVDGIIADDPVLLKNSVVVKAPSLHRP